MLASPAIIMVVVSQTNLVKEGETVYITSHRRPVAKLSPSQVDEALQVHPPDLTMDKLKNVSGIRPAAGASGLEELLEDRGRR